MSGGKHDFDLLKRLRTRELVLIGLVAVSALLANFPREFLETIGLDRKALLAVLAGAVLFGLFLYLRLFFFLAVIALIAGANMPEQIATALNISKLPIVLALVAIVGIGLVNYLVGLLPTGLEPKPRTRSPEGLRAMFYAVERNNAAYAQKLLAMRFDPNMHHENGYTPLAYAAMRGNPRMVEVFLGNGADPALLTQHGDTPVELALRAGHAEVAELLREARRGVEPVPEQAVNVIQRIEIKG
jgi:uncharacterized protein